MKNIRKFETTSVMENAVLEETSLVYNLETNGILSLPLGGDWVEEITFYISGCEYKAIYNMTWKECNYDTLFHTNYSFSMMIVLFSLFVYHQTLH